MTMQNRRQWLQSALGTSAAPFLKAAPLAPHDFKARLRGPILSFPTVYQRSGAIDHQGIRRMIDNAIRAGVKVVTLTRGNNHYDWLTWEETLELTRCMVESVAGRALTIAATGSWSTGQSARYARFAAEAGADGLQLTMPPEGTDASYATHFRTVAQAAARPIVIHGQPSMKLLRLLRDMDTVVAMKEEFTLDYTVPIYAEFGDRFSIFAGGTKARLLAYRPYGMCAYYSAFSTFAPDIAMRFWRAVEASDMKSATQFVLRYDVPFFNRWSHAFWLATLEVFGIAGRFMRAPRETLPEERMKDVADFYRGLGLLPSRS